VREVVLDTETTGLDPLNGDRVVEIGCVELFNHVETGRVFHRYVNPERDIPEQVLTIHGLTREFLAGHPVFAAVADEFLEFIADSPMVIHNAAFDLGFINAEMRRSERPPLPMERAVDTVALARRKFPGAPANLDALCARFRIDTSDRALHGALKDARLLAAVYLELIGGRQHGFALAAAARAETAAAGRAAMRPPRPHAPSPEEEAAHGAFVESLVQPLWRAGK
jgi:DNA polymerase-3 subunit epsilon